MFKCKLLEISHKIYIVSQRSSALVSLLPMPKEESSYLFQPFGQQEGNAAFQISQSEKNNLLNKAPVCQLPVKYADILKHVFIIHY